LSTTPKRLIEVAFPLKQTSLDSVHEKNVRHGHISTLHIWPARRPLAACRAALIATLLPDPGDPEERKQILERLGGKVVQKVKKKKDAEGRTVEEISEETEGGILHWGRESGPDLDWFREKIREAYGGRAPRVLDPFAGGGAIPLEAMRLGCEATAVDINPVAWFILKCTLEYPQKLAGQTRPLPEFVLQDRGFMEDYLKARGYAGAALQAQLDKLGLLPAPAAPELPFTEFSVKESGGHYNTGVDLEADLAWHVRAWGRWVLKEARKELAPYYPTYADFEPLVAVTGKLEQRPMTLVPLTAEGEPDIDALNAEFSPAYLADRSNPRWVAKPTVAYLWARTVTCKNCRATIPLLKTRWLCKKPGKRVLLTMTPNPEKTGVVFGVQQDVPVVGKNAAERKAHDVRVGGGTMSRSGATCPCCSGVMTKDDIRYEGKAGRLGSTVTSVIVNGQKSKEYRLPARSEVEDLGVRSPIVEKYDLSKKAPIASIAEDAKQSTWCIGYGLDTFEKLFNKRQLLVLEYTAYKTQEINDVLKQANYNSDWAEAISAYLAIAVDRIADYNSSLCHWHLREYVVNTFQRFALPMNWDFCEIPIISDFTGGYRGAIEWISLYIEHALETTVYSPEPTIKHISAKKIDNLKFDIVATDPPYYDAISYAAIMDFFYVWLRNTLPESIVRNAFSTSNTPKWDHSLNDGELIDDSKRFGGNKTTSKKIYEDGMFHVFQNCEKSLEDHGRLFVVFANKNPEAWETLVSAIIRAGFVVTGSWPIETEMANRTRALTGSALASSVWLVCKKRPSIARPGWDNKVLDEMRANIHIQLRTFWDAGIRGPDFVWAATGPALEAYSQYPVVKKANNPGEVLTVGEFLVQVRRMVVDFVVGRVLSGDGDEEISGLDGVTTYYLLHRHDFGLNDAPAGPCILYAVSCGLSDKDLADRFDLLARRGGKEQDESVEEETEEAETEAEGSGSSFRLKAWHQRKNPRMGYDPATDGSAEKLPLFPDIEREVQPSREIPLIDQVHRLMHLWKSGDVSKVNEYLDLRGARRNPLFHQLLQALIELAPAGSEERSLLESISNHVGGKQINAPRLFHQ